MKILIFLMAIVALSILIGSHLFLYLSLVHFFNITNPVTKKILFYVFLILAASFIFSFSVISMYSNALTHAFYIFTSGWMALMVNLLWAGILGWLIFFVAKYFSVNIKMNLVGAGLILLTIALVVYGYFNAQNLRLKFITVKINNLPPDWQGKTAVQISDVHAGIINNKKFLDKMFTELSHIRKDIVFITGDYFDSRDGSFEELTAPFKDVKAEKGIYFITGNHEKYIGEDKVLTAMAGAGVKILKDEIINIDGLNIIGIDYPGEMQTKNVNWIFEKVNPDEPNILLFHEPKLIDLAKASSVDLQLAGHTHDGQLWPFGFFTKLIYGKYHFGLFQDGDYSIYTTSGVGTWGPPIRTANTPEIVVITLEAK